jgi:hypothetical protein
MTESDRDWAAAVVARHFGTPMEDEIEYELMLETA